VDDVDGVVACSGVVMVKGETSPLVVAVVVGKLRLSGKLMDDCEL
jgi:hypothetical protein